jgi:hypothetical protein
VFRRRRNVSRWMLHQTTITAHLELQGPLGFYHSASRYYLARASPNHSMTLCKPEQLPPFCKLEQPQSQNSCKDIECSAAGGMYRDGCYIKPLSKRISSCKDIECSAAGGMYRDGYYIKLGSQRISILFGSCLTKSLDDLLQTRTAAIPK